MTTMIAEDNCDENLIPNQEDERKKDKGNNNSEDEKYIPVSFNQKLKELNISSLNKRYERYMLIQIGEGISQRLNYNFI